MVDRLIPELLSPAGSLDAVRAALANGADSVYLGAQRFNARDEGAQLTLDEVEEACRLAHMRARRIYLTLNILIKPAELEDALLFLGEALDRGIDAVIVQDLGLIRLIQRVYPTVEIHGSTQMTVHDGAGAAVVKELGVSRVVLARENTLEDIRAIHAAVPDLALESFVHGALCISYSGQCLMSGMISERSANRGSCAQSCRKDYVLTDVDDGTELDRGYLISAKDLAAHDHLERIAEVGVRCLKIEGRKKRAEYVATVTHGYREFLDRLGRGDSSVPSPADVQPLVQIYSRGFTGGMYGGRAGRQYVTRTQSDNRGVVLGTVVAARRGEVIVDVTATVQVGDGLAFEAPDGLGGPQVGFTVTAVRTLRSQPMLRQALATRTSIPAGWRVIRSSDRQLLENARTSYAALPAAPTRRMPLAIRVSGTADGPLQVTFSADGKSITVRSKIILVASAKYALNCATLREQLGRLGDTPFILTTLDDAALAPGLFLPISELNRLRQRATEELTQRCDSSHQAVLVERAERVRAAARDIAALQAHGPGHRALDEQDTTWGLTAQVYRTEDALAAAESGATEVCFDPFLRHPPLSIAKLRQLESSLLSLGVTLRLRTPTIVRPAERRSIGKWLDFGSPILSGHLGLIAELGRAGRDITADYAVNVMNAHSAAELFRLRARRIVLSVELTADEIALLVAPWKGRAFDVIV